MEVCWDTDPKVRPTFDEIFLELNNALKLCQKDANGEKKIDKGNKIDIKIYSSQSLMEEESKAERREEKNSRR